MFLHCILLAFCSTLDSFGIGITYGLKNTHILFSAKITLFICCFLMSLLSLFLGNCFSAIFPNYITSLFGSLILVFIGVFFIFSSFKKEKPKENKKIVEKARPKVYQFFIQFLGITIQIIRNPTNSDFDHSNHIDGKEAIFLGFALSLDTIGIGLSSSMLTIPLYFFPLCVSIFQFFFLSFGNFLGRKIQTISNIPENIWSILAGFLLIFIGFTKLI